MIRFIRTVECVNGSGQPEAPKFAADIEYFLNNGWELVASGAQMNSATSEMYLRIYSWAYIRHNDATKAYDTLKARSYSAEPPVSN